MAAAAKPRAILFDVDDTIISSYGRPDLAWRAVATELVDHLVPHHPDRIADAITTFGMEFWSDPVRHQTARIRIAEARRVIVAGAFERLAAEDKSFNLPRPVVETLADRFTAYRDEQLHILPDAHRVIDEMRTRGLRLALVTNGGTEVQRAKITRFDLAQRFDHVQIEEEAGFGKPDERAYRHAMTTLGVAPNETWMVGDNLEWEVVAPQRLGIHAVWYDLEGQGLPTGSDAQPDLIIRSLRELLDHLA
jgi:putative hydrolase of the HAD superfamily